jgi:Domain of unknown function (DUF1844)
MPEDEAESSGFKVVDRRSFTNRGERVAERPAKEEERGSGGPSASEPSFAKDTTDSLDVDSAEATGFTTLVSYLSTTAMFQLGLLPGPSGEVIPPDLPNGRRTIDLLEVLQEKTRGNLTPDESRLLGDVLYELRMSFVEVEKHQKRKGK